VTGITGVFTPTRYLYTHSLAKFYTSKFGKNNICKNIPIVGNLPFGGEGTSGFFSEPWCDRNEVYQLVRNHVPGLKELLFTYDEALFNHETGKFIDYPVNESLINLNTNYDILNTNIDTKLFVGF
jgi:hypothetical protein